MIEILYVSYHWRAIERDQIILYFNVLTDKFTFLILKHQIKA